MIRPSVFLCLCIPFFGLFLVLLRLFIDTEASVFIRACICYSLSGSHFLVTFYWCLKSEMFTAQLISIYSWFTTHHHIYMIDATVSFLSFRPHWQFIYCLFFTFCKGLTSSFSLLKLVSAIITLHRQCHHRICSYLQKMADSTNFCLMDFLKD